MTYLVHIQGHGTKFSQLAGHGTLAAANASDNPDDYHELHYGLIVLSLDTGVDHIDHCVSRDNKGLKSGGMKI